MIQAFFEKKFQLTAPKLRYWQAHLQQYIYNNIRIYNIFYIIIDKTSYEHSHWN